MVIGNKSKPNIFYQQHPLDGYHQWGAHIMLRKFKGNKTAKYVGSGTAQIVAIDKLPPKLIKQKLTEIAINTAKKGRYHDWMWQPPKDKSAYYFASDRKAKEGGQK